MENILEQQIAQLEEQLRDKKSALEGQGTAPEAMPSDKELLHQAVGEKIQQYAPNYQPPVPASQSQTPVSGPDPFSYQDPQLQPGVQQLVDLAFNNSLEEAIQQAVKINNAALLDAFHDVIVDQLFGELAARKKIVEVK